MFNRCHTEMYFMFMIQHKMSNFGIPLEGHTQKLYLHGIFIGIQYCQYIYCMVILTQI